MKLRPHKMTYRVTQGDRYEHAHYVYATLKEALETYHYFRIRYKDPDCWLTLEKVVELLP